MTTEEARYSRDLDTYHYGGKWRAAKELISRSRPELLGIEYWLEVRLCFLELGGYYLSQVDELGRPSWNHHPA